MIFALTAFVMMLPFFVVVLLSVWITGKSSPFFRQLRPGKDAKPFNVIKFKTMTEKKDSQGHHLPDDQRLTAIGKLVRKTSLDELPQLLNVIGGQMSLIGPRPLLMEYLELYSPEQRRRHEIRPGITGWAQVNGRNTVEWRERFAYDVWYVDNVSFLLDVKILWLTLIKVLRAEGISGKTSITMEKFKGNTDQEK